MDTLNFEYPDYERLNRGAEGAKRKRVVSVLSRQAARMVKEEEKTLKKRKSSPEPKAAALKKRKAATPEPKVTEVEEETPSTPPTVEVEEILKVMTESLSIKLLSPLGPHLTKLFQKKQEPSARKKADGLKKRRIGSVMQAIEKTPPSASVSKIAPTASTEATAEANTSVEAAAATEATNLETTSSGIDKLLLDIGIEETVAAAEQVMAQCLTKERKLSKLLRLKKILSFGTGSDRNYLRLKRRSYRNTTFPMATSQEPCSLVEPMKRPWDVSVTVSGRR
jgi:hypothetical protein